jgi:hypothetical protein
VDRERHARVKQVFREAIRWAPEERAAVVDALAGDDAVVQGEVRSLLAHHVEAPAVAGEGPGDGAGGDAGGGGAGGGGRTRAEILREARAGGAAAGWPLERVVRTLEPSAGALAELADRGIDPDVPPRIDRAAAAVAAPEQLLPQLGPVGPWTDVYALALVCVERMLGRPATDGAAGAALARARDEAAQPTPRAVGLEVPAAVEAVLARALAMRPMERYQDVRRFWAALRESVAASAAAAAGASTSTGQRRAAWAPVAAVVAAVAALAAAAIAIAAAGRCG